jgi:purine-binding chemotaxis protein CheW
MLERRERPDPNKSLVGFLVGRVHYAVPISAVREIINPTELTELPHLPRALAGVADHRGDVIPVIDLRERFGLEPLTDRSRVKWVLVNVVERAVGLVVDQVTDVFGTGGDELRPAPSLGGGDDESAISGVISHAGTLTFVLDVARFEGLTAAISQADLERISLASAERA